MNIEKIPIADRVDRDKTLIQLLEERARDKTERQAYTFIQQGEEIGRLTYSELERQAKSIAARLQQLTVKGDRVLLLYPAGLEFIAAFFGCLCAGTIATPAYPPRNNQNLGRLMAIVQDARATVILTTTSILDRLAPRLPEYPELASMQWLPSDTIPLSLAELWQAPNISLDSLAFLQYTSGSTGTPKGVQISHGNLLHNLALIYQCFGHNPQSQGVIWLPPYHDMGLIGGVLQPLYGGFPVTLMSPLDFLQKPLRWLQAVSQYRATTSGAPNFAYALCLQKIKPEQLSTLDLSSWELAFTGAEPIDPDTLDRFADYFAVCGFRKEAFYPCYGMAETTLIVSGGKKNDPPVIYAVDANALELDRVVAAKNDSNAKKIVGCGQNLPEQKIAIVAPQTLRLCSDDRVGEIWISGPSVAQGYWQQPEETAKTFRAHLADREEETFLRTGDLGFLKDGELFITGRIKDVIIVRGQNHYPQDIETTVANSHPALKSNSSAAFSVTIRGQERLILVQEVERSHLRKLDIQEIGETIRQVVTAQHDLQVHALLLLKPASLPKTSSGKVQRHACRTGFLNGTLQVVEDWCESPQNKVKFKHLQSEIDSLYEQLLTPER